MWNKKNTAFLFVELLAAPWVMYNWDIPYKTASDGNTRSEECEVRLHSQ